MVAVFFCMRVLRVLRHVASTSVSRRPLLHHPSYIFLRRLWYSAKYLLSRYLTVSNLAILNTDTTQALER